MKLTFIDLTVYACQNRYPRVHYAQKGAVCVPWSQRHKHSDIFRSTKNANPKLILKANHVLTGSNPCIKLLAEGADTAPARSRAIVIDDKTRGKVDERLTKRPDADYYPVCRICKGLTAKEHMKYGCREMQLPDTPEGIVYHLRAW